MMSQPSELVGMPKRISFQVVSAFALAAAGIAWGWRCYQRWRARQTRESELNRLVDLASNDSFPASDPPSFAGGSTRSASGRREC